jgi:hypothetical protein
MLEALIPEEIWSVPIAKAVLPIWAMVKKLKHSDLMLFVE